MRLTYYDFSSRVQTIWKDLKNEDKLIERLRLTAENELNLLHNISLSTQMMFKEFWKCKKQPTKVKKTSLKNDKWISWKRERNKTFPIGILPTKQVTRTPKCSALPIIAYLYEHKLNCLLFNPDKYIFYLVDAIICLLKIDVACNGTYSSRELSSF